MLRASNKSEAGQGCRPWVGVKEGSGGSDLLTRICPAVRPCQRREPSAWNLPPGALVLKLCFMEGIDSGGGSFSLHRRADRRLPGNGLAVAVESRRREQHPGPDGPARMS